MLQTTQRHNMQKQTIMLLCSDCLRSRETDLQRGIEFIYLNIIHLVFVQYLSTYLSKNTISNLTQKNKNTDFELKNMLLIKQKERNALSSTRRSSLKNLTSKTGSFVFHAYSHKKAYYYISYVWLRSGYLFDAYTNY